MHRRHTVLKKFWPILAHFAVTRKVKLSCHLDDPVHHLLLLDVAYDYIVNHFLGLTQQTPVTQIIMAAFALSLVCVDDDLYIMMKCLSVCL